MCHPGATADFVAGAVGGVVGAGIGFVNPFESYGSGIIAGTLANVSRQMIGNEISGQPLSNLDPIIAISSGFGAATGGQIISGYGITNPYVQGLISGITTGVSELGGQAVSPGPTNFGDAYNYFSGSDQFGSSFSSGGGASLGVGTDSGSDSGQ